MKAYLCLYIVLLFIPLSMTGQHLFRLSGEVLDENNQTLPGAHILINKGRHVAVTLDDGQFLIKELPGGNYILHVSYLGYKPYTDTLWIESDSRLMIRLLPEVRSLHEVVIKGDYAGYRNKQNPVNVEVAGQDYIRSNMAGSLVETLERMPGLTSIEIGSGQSKPVIRGLGFNRVVVVENGIKHEGQQWGADHGLEIDQYAVNRVEVIKGPASFMYGSDAIGGVIKLDQTDMPGEYTSGGSVDLTGKTNNNLLGLSANVYARRKKLFFNSRFTFSDYADYRVPADCVDIYSYKAPLFKNRLRNTAGTEQAVHLMLGIAGDKSVTRLFISNLHHKAGFFANARGLEPRMVDTVLHDASDRDIQIPYQVVNHFKLTGKSSFTILRQQFDAEMGYQRNYRQEWSPYVSHGYMPAVFTENTGFPSDLELQFDKQVYSLNLKGTFGISDKISLSAGIMPEFQNNRIGGNGFIIPEFSQFSWGSFLYGKIAPNDHIILHTGLRYDFGTIKTTAYSDWFQSPLINEAGDTTGYAFLQRAQPLTRAFNSLTWSLGMNFNKGTFGFKANLGKSFRMPGAKELAANGVNYHHFCYEVGNSNLDAEISYQLDLGVEWEFPKLTIGANPFVNYFPNYIFLNPSYEHDYLYGAGNQLYFYTQSQVIRYGGEADVVYKMFRQMRIGLTGEYVYAEQLSGAKNGYTLPFAPPANMLVNFRYSPQMGKYFGESYISVDWNLVASQQNVVPPEEKTAGYQTWDISAGVQISAGKQRFSADFQIRNLFNKKYFNHTSYYRIINVPESGRNVVINLTLPFAFQTGKKSKSIK